MSLSRIAKRRDETEREIIEVLEAHGAIVCALDRPCDLFVGYRGLWVAVEVKSGSGKLNGYQEAFKDQVLERGLAYAILRDEKDALALLLGIDRVRDETIH